MSRRAGGELPTVSYMSVRGDGGGGDEGASGRKVARGGGEDCTRASS